MKTLTTLIIAITSLGLATQLTSCQTSSGSGCCKSGGEKKDCCATKASAGCCDKGSKAGEGHVH